MSMNDISIENLTSLINLHRKSKRKDAPIVEEADVASRVKGVRKRKSYKDVKIPVSTLNDVLREESREVKIAIKKSLGFYPKITADHTDIPTQPINYNYNNNNNNNRPQDRVRREPSKHRTTVSTATILIKD